MDWAERLIQERAALEVEVKILRLSMIVKGPVAGRAHISAAQLDLMRQQLDVMTDYRRILSIRILDAEKWG